MASEIQDASIYVTSMYGYHTKQPLVSIKLRDVAIQITPREARDLALNLLSAAEASEGDAFLIEYAKRALKLDEKEIATILHDFREWRAEREEAEDGPDL